MIEFLPHQHQWMKERKMRRKLRVDDPGVASPDYNLRVPDDDPLLAQLRRFHRLMEEEEK